MAKKDFDFDAALNEIFEEQPDIPDEVKVNDIKEVSSEPEIDPIVEAKKKAEEEAKKKAKAEAERKKKEKEAEAEEKARLEEQKRIEAEKKRKALAKKKAAEQQRLKEEEEKKRADALRKRKLEEQKAKKAERVLIFGSLGILIIATLLLLWPHFSLLGAMFLSTILVGLFVALSPLWCGKLESNVPGVIAIIDSVLLAISVLILLIGDYSFWKVLLFSLLGGGACFGIIAAINEWCERKMSN
jgi:cation transport ATPase